MNGPAPLQLDGLSKRIDRFRLGPLDVRLAPGLTYALIGPNGSGKTTLLKCCANLIRPTSGEVRVFGETCHGRNETAVKQRVAYVPAVMEGCEPLTLREIGRLLGDWYAAWDDGLFVRRAERFRLALDQPYGKLSLGDRKKASLTLAMATRAPLLLLDEPTNGLDIESKNRLKDMLVEDMESLERTVLMATHSVDDVRRLADAILLLKDGRLSGPYDKDALTGSWRRLWLAERLPDPAGVPGVVSLHDDPYPHLVTRDVAATLAGLAERGVGVTKEQPLPLEELLEYMVKEEALLP